MLFGACSLACVRSSPLADAKGGRHELAWTEPWWCDRSSGAVSISLSRREPLCGLRHRGMALLWRGCACGRQAGGGADEALRRADDEGVAAGANEAVAPG